MYNFGSFDAFIVKPTILPEICSTTRLRDSVEEQMLPMTVSLSNDTVVLAYMCIGLYDRYSLSCPSRAGLSHAPYRVTRGLGNRPCGAV